VAGLALGMITAVLFIRSCTLLPPDAAWQLNWQAGHPGRPGCHIGVVSPVNCYDRPRWGIVTDG